MKQINMTCLVNMPDDLFAAAAISLKVKPAWEGFLLAMNQAGVDFSVKLDTVTVVVPVPVARRRKEKADTPRYLPIAEEDPDLLPNNAANEPL